MLRRVWFITACLAACLVAQEGAAPKVVPGVAPTLAPTDAPTIPQLIRDGDAFYLKGNYEAARLAFTQAWELAQETPRDNPVRYDILKRLTSVRAAAGEFADADNWLQQAITWRENTLGLKDPKIPDDLLISVGLCRGLKDFDRALVILRRVQSLHVEAYTFNSSAVADDFSRLGSVYGEQKKIDSAINSVDAALAIRTKLGGPLDPALIREVHSQGN
jgi:tetratricopeptide (TPR) repeat protein